MKKDNLVRGNLAYKDGKTEFILDSRGKFWLNPATGKIQRGRPWVLRKVHSWLWKHKYWIGAVFLMLPTVLSGMASLYSISFLATGAMEGTTLTLAAIGMATIFLSLLAYFVSTSFKEPKDDCDC